MDCGEGTQLQMQRYAVKWKNLHHIFISHLHGDHYFGLPGLVNSMSLLGRTAPLTIHAPQGLAPILEAILAVANTVLNYPLQIRPLPVQGGELVDNASYRVRCFPLQHGIECHGFLVETKTRGRRILPLQCAAYGIEPPFFEALKQGNDHVMPDGTIVKNELVTEDGPAPRRYAYCTDTLCTDKYLEMIYGVDALYHEATYLQQDEPKAVMRYHSTATQAARLAAMAQVKLLLLGHFSSKYKELEPFKDEAAPHFANVVVTVEGVAYDI